MCDVIVHIAKHVILISGVHIFIVYSPEVTVILYAKKLVVPISVFYIFRLAYIL